MVSADFETLSSPSMRLFSLETFSSNISASEYTHFARLRMDFCFWLSCMRCRKVVMDGEGMRDLLARMELETFLKPVGGFKSYFLRRPSISVKRWAILVTAWATTFSISGRVKI